MRATIVFAGALLVAAVSVGGAGRAASPDANAPVGEIGVRIGPEDVLSVIVRNEPEISRQVTVRPDGKITLPLVEDIEVAGLTIQEVREKATEAVGKVVQQPYVTIILDEYNSFRVSFLGEVNTQGPLSLRRPTRFLQALAQAGGVTEFSKKEVFVLRESDGAQRRIEIDLKALMRGNKLEQNIYLAPGDTVLVN